MNYSILVTTFIMGTSFAGDFPTCKSYDLMQDIRTKMQTFIAQSPITTIDQYIEGQELIRQLHQDRIYAGRADRYACRTEKKQITLLRISYYLKNQHDYFQAYGQDSAQQLSKSCLRQIAKAVQRYNKYTHADEQKYADMVLQAQQELTRRNNSHNQYK